MLEVLYYHAKVWWGSDFARSRAGCNNVESLVCCTPVLEWTLKSTGWKVALTLLSRNGARNIFENNVLSHCKVHKRSESDHKQLAI